MGAFATWFCSASRTGSVGRVDLDADQTLLLADFEPTPDYLERLFTHPPRLCVFPVAPQTPQVGVSYACYQPDTNPLVWDALVTEAVRRGVRTAAILLPLDSVPGRTFLHLHRLGIRSVVGWADGRTITASPAFLGLAKLARRTHARFFRRRSVGPTVAECRSLLVHGLPRQRAADPGQLRIAHFVTSLNSGGAEHQACYAAIGQAEQGHSVRVCSRLALVGEAAHYLPLLEAAGVPARLNGSRWDRRFPQIAAAAGFHAGLIDGQPLDLALMVQDLLGELLLNPVDVLHSYVDDCNIVAGIAGCLAGVPAVILSFRNGNPTHFPGLHRPWMLPWYEALKSHPAVRFSANSNAGARDYEAWLDLPTGSVPVIPNAFTPPALPEPSARLRKRRELGIPDDAPLIAGVFRLHPEKRPLYFLECIVEIRRRIPNVRVIVAGVGILEAEVHRAVVRLGLTEIVRLLGQRSDIPGLLGASDVLLLVSDWEGTPNVVLEAQYCRCVPVVTAAGGSPEALAHGVTGWLVGLDDKAEAVRRVVELIVDHERRRRMADRGPSFVRQWFSSAKLHHANHSLYADALRTTSLVCPTPA